MQGCKRILTHLIRVSKRTSWQHLYLPLNISFDTKCVIPPAYFFELTMVVSRKHLISVRVNLVCYSFSDRPISIPGFVSYFTLPVVDDVV